MAGKTPQMGGRWLGIWHPQGRYFDSAGLSEVGESGTLLLREANALLPQGALVFELRLPDLSRPEPMVLFERGGDWPLRLALTAIPGGGINLVLEHYGSVEHRTLNPSRDGRADQLRLTLSWDAPGFRGRLALERPEGMRAQIVEFDNPRPWRLEDLQALLSDAPEVYLAPGVEMIALSREPEPVGPMPGLCLATMIETDKGARPLGLIRRGDLVRSSSGELVPVLHVVRRQVPSFGAWQPIRLRAPYFGLDRDLILAPHQRLLLTGTEVEYLFGSEAVLAPAETLAATKTASKLRSPSPLMTYGQLILPGHEVLMASGLGVESLFLGRLRRDRAAVAASLLGTLDRNALPEHAQPRYPVVRAFDAAVLAEQRMA